MSEVNFRKEKDNDVYILENEIKNFEHKIKQSEEYSRYSYMSIYSAFTHYGLQRIYDGLLMRISLDNRPVTILQTQSPKKCDSLYNPPISTLDGKEPFDHQRGGVYIDKEGKEKTLSDLYFWISYSKKIITNETRKAMKEILKDIQTGIFPKEWLQENLVGRPVYIARKRQDQEHRIEEVGNKLRGMMSWLKED